MKLGVEVLVSLIHTAPFVAMDMTQIQRGRRIVYRLETVLCALMFVRVYHVWRSIYGRIQYAVHELKRVMGVPKPSPHVRVKPKTLMRIHLMCQCEYT